MPVLPTTPEAFARRAVKFIAGGFRPTHARTESWFGNVFLFREEEGIPTDADGGTLVPLLQLSLPGIPHVPEALSGIALLTIFIPEDPLSMREAEGSNWHVREYASLEGLVRKEIAHTSSIRPFPIRFELVERDYPQGLPEEGFDGLDADRYPSVYAHKLGGWPTFCQEPVDFDEGVDFVLQIASDGKLAFTVAGSGQLLFTKERATGRWRVYSDFF